MTELRDRSVLEPDTDTPFDHRHGNWVQMDLTTTEKTARGGVRRTERTFVCPTCGYEIRESSPEDSR